MASNAKVAVAKQVEPWDVVASIKDVVLAFIYYLVNPLLLSSISHVSPSQDDQNSVAKQMHAVVLLYNYYHRKQNRELVFLDFLSFCKLAVLVQPTLVAFFKQNELKGLHIAEDQLSITGKAMKNACNIAASLDALQDVPYIEGWQISKVAVLLIDSKKENCMLQYSSVTKGVWSPIEKELNESSMNHEISAQQKIGNKRKLNQQKASMGDAHLLQLAYDAVKVAEGYDRTDLKLLETHIAYSLSKEKSVTRLYIMQYSGSFSIEKLISLKDLVQSLQGPLAEKFPFGCWGTKEVVNFHHMLPYLKFLECWRSRNGSDLSSLNGCNARSFITSCKEEVTESRTFTAAASQNDWGKLDRTNGSSGVEATTVDNNKKSKLSRLIVARSPGNISESTRQDGIVADRFDKKYDMDSSKNLLGRNAETSAKDRMENKKGSLSSIPETQPPKMTKYVDPMLEECSVVDSTIRMGSQIIYEVSSLNDHRQEGIEKLNQKLDVLVSVKHERIGMYDESLGEDNAEFCAGLLCYPSRELQTSNVNDVKETGSNSEHTSTKANSKIRVYHHRRKKNSSSKGSAPPQDNIICLKVDVVDSSKSNQDQCRKEKSGTEINDPVASNQDALAATGKELVQLEGDIDSAVKIDAEKNNENTEVKSIQSRSCCQDRCRKEKSGTEINDPVASNQNALAATGKELVQLEGDIDSVVKIDPEKNNENTEVKSIQSSEEVQNALAVLLGKRQQAHSEICILEDTLLLCEDNIERIRDGGEAGLARRCIESISTGKVNEFLLEDDKDMRQTNKLHAIYLPGKYPCQDLEYICTANNWRLPRYHTEPSSCGKFVSTVVVKGKDIELSSRGGLESKPRQARESGARQMIAKLQSYDG